MILLPKVRIAILLLGTALAITPYLHSQTAQPPKPASPDPVELLLAKTQDALDHNDFPAAITMLQTIIAGRPTEALPHFELGYAYAQLKRNDEAASEFRRAIALDDKLSAAHLNLGLLLRDSDLNAAAASFRRAAELMPGQARPHFLAGDALERANKMPDAIREYEIAVNLAPKEAPMRMALGRALLRASRTAYAEIQFREAASLGSGPDASLGLAEALLRQNKNAEAADQFAAYLKDKPDDAAVHVEHAAALESLTRFDEAIAELDRADQIAQPSPDSLRLRASIYLQQKKWAEAAAAVAKALPALPEDAQLYAALGHARLNLRDFTAAETALRHSLMLDPSPEQPMRDLVAVLYFSKQYALTLGALDQLAARANLTALDWFFRATSYDKLRHVQDALMAYENFLNLDMGALPDQELETRGRMKILWRELGRK